MSQLVYYGVPILDPISWEAAKCLPSSPSLSRDQLIDSISPPSSWYTMEHEGVENQGASRRSSLFRKWFPHLCRAVASHGPDVRLFASRDQPKDAASRTTANDSLSQAAVQLPKWTRVSPIAHMYEVLCRHWIVRRLRRLTLCLATRSLTRIYDRLKDLG